MTVPDLTTALSGPLLDVDLVLPRLAERLGLGSENSVYGLKSKMLAVDRGVSLSGKRWGGRKMKGD